MTGVQTCALPILSGLGPAGTEKTGGRGAPAPGGGPPAAEREAAETGAAAAEIRPLVLWENDDFLVLDKPRGTLVHGSGGLDGPVRRYLLPRLPPSLAFAPGPLHRLDRNTTGVLFFAKSIGGARLFSRALREGRTRKTYIALVEGDLRGTAVWEDTLRRDEKSRVTRPSPAAPPGTEGGPPASGKTARSAARPLLRGKGLTLCEIVIGTGRTHQIRAQAAAHGHPLAGDVKYGGKPFPGGYFLHAREYRELGGAAGLRDDSAAGDGSAPPRGRTGTAPGAVTARAPLPDEFRRAAARIFGPAAVAGIFGPPGA